MSTSIIANIILLLLIRERNKRAYEKKMEQKWEAKRTTGNSQMHAALLPRPVRADVKSMTPEEFRDHRRQICQRYRDNMSSQKKTAVRAKDKKRKQEERDRKKEVIKFGYFCTSRWMVI